MSTTKVSNVPDLPSEATISASSRVSICEDLIGNTVFKRFAKRSFQSNMQPVQQPLPYVYMLRNFRISHFSLGTISRSRNIQEYVLVCSYKEIESHNFSHYYVSKLYGEEPGHRYVFPEEETDFRFMHMMLVEESAEAYVKPYFNVELYYLELRTYTQPGKLLVQIASILLLQALQ